MVKAEPMMQRTTNRAGGAALRALLAAFLLLGAGCSALHLGRDPLSGQRQRRWVESTLAGMSLRQQAAGLVVIEVVAGFSNAEDPARREIEALVADLEVGGIAMWHGDPWDEAITIARLQAIAPRPLLVAADNEWGLSQRVTDASTFPKAMALGATGDTLLAHAAGYVTGRETRALGIHMGYAPVADVNSNPLNPIISIRSFGEDPELVARLAVAWARGARQAGVLTTAKHFPGHGDVSVDSHIELPVVDADRERLDRVELLPFRALISDGVDAVMTAHLWITALDPDETVPASISPNVTARLLRDELGFEGLIVTDALRMGAVVRHYGVEEAAVRTIAAGADLLLLPADARRSVEGIVAAVEAGRLDPALVTRAARRLLEVKARLGLHVRRQVPLSGVDRAVGDPAAADLARTIAERAVTVVRNEDGLLPLGRGSGSTAPQRGEWTALAAPRAAGPFTRRHTELDSGRVLLLGLSSDPGSGPVGREFFRPLEEIYPAARHLWLYPESTPDEIDAVLSGIESASLVVAAVMSRVRDQKGHAAVTQEHARLLNYASARGVPVVVAAFGPPYFLMQFPGVTAYLAAYDYDSVAQRAAGEVVLGAVGARGRLPVSLPGLYELGWGLTVGPAEGR